MKKGIWQFLAGAVQFEIRGGQGERFLNLCAEQGIPIQQVQPAAQGYLAWLPVRHYRRVHRTARRCRCVLRVRRRKGLGFLLGHMRRRRGVWLGLALGAAALLLCPGMVWNIEFVDFTPVQEQSLRQQLYENDIYEGAFVDADQLRRVADRIFVEEETYNWVALNFVKGRLVAEKRDRNAAPQIAGGEITDLVAKDSGVITAVDLEGGFLTAWPGQAVAEGALLATGANVNDLTGRVAYSRAAGQVYARMEKVYICTQPLELEAQVPTGRTVSGWRMKAGALDIPLTPAPSMEGLYTQTVTRQGLAPLGFHLPATLERTQLRGLETIRVRLSPGLAAQKARLQIVLYLRECFPDYVMESCKETVTQTERDVTVELRVIFTANIARQVPHQAAEP